MARVQDDDEMVKFLEHEIELVSRKRTGSSKPTKRQAENESVKERILNTFRRGNDCQGDCGCP